MQLFYSPEISETTTDFTFTPDESKHIVRVLRKQQGDRLNITNGRGYWFVVEIESSAPKECLAKVISIKREEAPPSALHMVVAPTKMNDRYEWFIEKATEIGVGEITPIICDRSERKIIKIDRMRRIVQSAMKQSLQTYLPKLHDPISFEDFLQQHHQAVCYIAHCEDQQKLELKSVQSQHTKTVILIGPEGDFSSSEIERALQKGFQPISLGKTRLRTETAAIVACALMAN